MVNLFTYIVVIVMVTGFGILGIIGIRQGRKELQISSSLLREGVIVEGHITRHSTGIARTGEWFSLTYSYEYNGKSYLQDQQVSQNYYKARDIGTVVPVRCLPSNPAVVALVEDGFAVPAASCSVVVSYCVLGFAIFILAIFVLVALPH